MMGTPSPAAMTRVMTCCRQERLAKQRELGLFDEAPELFTATGPGVPAWDESGCRESDGGRLSRIMEIYAGMIQKVDTELDRLLAYLECKGSRRGYGRSSSSRTMALTVGMQITLHLPSGITLSLLITATRTWVSQGLSRSSIGVGAGSAGHLFSGYKGSTFEGGIRVPAILSSAEHLSRRAGYRTETVSITDFAPTIMELAGIAFEESDFTGRSITPIMRNESNSYSIQG